MNDPIKQGDEIAKVAVTFDDGTGRTQSVSAAAPMPVTVVSGGSAGAASLADQSVVDAAGVFWLVRDNGTTLTYVNWATGAVGTPTVPVAPAGKLTGEQLISTQYNATAAATGYAIGDILTHVVILNIATTPATVINSVWANITQGSILAGSPAAANIAAIEKSVAVSSLPPTPTGNNNIGQVTPAYMPPQLWAGTPIDMRPYGTVTIVCTSAPTAGTVAVSPDNASDYIGQTLVMNSASGINTTANITAPGVYTLSGRAWVQGAFTGGTCFISGGQ